MFKILPDHESIHRVYILRNTRNKNNLSWDELNMSYPNLSGGAKFLRSYIAHVLIP